MRRALFVASALVCGLFGGTARPADAYYVCETCKLVWFARTAYCKPVQDGEGGVTECQDTADSMGTWCREEGIFCEATTVIDDGGDGDGGGSGGSSCVFSPSGCPPECFSCSSGGGGGGGFAN